MSLHVPGRHETLSKLTVDCGDPHARFVLHLSLFDSFDEKTLLVLYSRDCSGTQNIGPLAVKHDVDWLQELLESLGLRGLLMKEEITVFFEWGSVIEREKKGR